MTDKPEKIKEIHGEGQQFSSSVAEIAKALLNVQKAMKNPKKEHENPYFESKYADLADVWDAVRDPLAKNGLSVVQLATGGNGEAGVTTMLLHTSGEWIRGHLSMKLDKNTPQGAGSCLTYARRYALSAMVGVCPEDDDDANAATRHEATRQEESFDVPSDAPFEISEHKGKKYIWAEVGDVFSEVDLVEAGLKESKRKGKFFSSDTVTASYRLMDKYKERLGE